MTDTTAISERDARIIALRAEHKTVLDIAELLNCSQSTVTNRIKALGLTAGGKKPPRPELTEADIETLRAVRRCGTAESIAVACGLTQSGVWDRLRRLVSRNYLRIVDRGVTPRVWALTEAGEAALRGAS